MIDPFVNAAHVQGSPEWLEERRNHIGASDAAAVLGVSRWMTPFQLWQEKLGLVPGPVENDAMRRGTALEPLARACFEKKTGLEVFPQCVYHQEHSFMMSSLDGLSICGKHAVEIKCPGQKAHKIALDGKVPDYYMPQLQHQLACLGLPMINYFSFDGSFGAIVEVHRDEEYIERLIKEEKKFWEFVETKTPPPLSDRDYQDRESPMWIVIGDRLAEIDKSLSSLKEERDTLKKELIRDAAGKSCRGGGVTLSKSFPKGRIIYDDVPELEGVDLDKYRAKSREQWTLTVGKKR